jgi:hypothetical protein
MEMTMGSKTFRVAVAKEKIEFTLEYLDHNNPRSFTFHCRPTIPVGMILEFAAVGSEDNGKPDAESGAKAMAMVQDIFRAAIVEEELSLWEKLLKDPNVAIDINTYSEIAGWLAGEYTARPTGENSGTSSQDPSSGQDSTAGVSPVVLSYSRTEPVAATP